MKPYGIIYLIVNLLNGKRYVGQTTHRLARRWNWHIAHSRDTKRKRSYISLAIAKYGRENFKIEKLAEAHDAESLTALETKYIQELNTLAPTGYNLILEDKNLRIISESTRKKCSEGGKKGWAETISNPKKLAARRIVQHRAGVSASIRNRERRGEKVIKNTSSEFVGVCLSGRKGKPWKGYFQENGKTIQKRFLTEIEAAKFYDENVIRLYGKSAKTNFCQRFA